MVLARENKKEKPFEVVFPRHQYSGTKGHKLTADVHGSEPKLLTVSDAVQSHAGCKCIGPWNELDTQWY
jgi:hypothetical protein